MLVSVLTPTYNRSDWFPLAIHCFKNQTYKNLEWIIIDDSETEEEIVWREAGKSMTELSHSPIEDMAKDISGVRYYREKRMKLGAKRNMLNKLAKGDILVNWDDDDYYPPERIAYCVKCLIARPVEIVGSSRMNIYFFHDQKIRTVGPYGNFHATASTWAFKKTLLNQSPGFDDNADKAEEKQFLKGFSIPLFQLDPEKVVLVISHTTNTVDKSKMTAEPSKYAMADTNRKIKDYLRKDKWALNYILDKQKQK